MPRILLIALLAASIAFSGCATGAGKKTSKPLVLKKDEAVVFGKIVIVENGEPRTPYSVWAGGPTPFFYRAESEKTVRPKWRGRGWSKMLSEDGSFYIRLPRGTYIIYRLEYGYVVIPRVAFQAESAGEAYYVGTLRIDLDAKKTFWGRKIEKINGIEVADEFDEARAGLMKEYPGFQGEASKSLMIHDSEIPALGGLQNRHALMGVLNSLGMGLLILSQ